MQGTLFTVNQPMPQEFSYPKNQMSVSIDSIDGAITMFVGLPSLTAVEKKIFSKGTFDLGFFVQEEIIYLSIIFQDRVNRQHSLTFDLAYHVALVIDDKVQNEIVDLLPVFKDLKAIPSATIPLTLHFFDTETGILKGIRTVGTDNVFSQCFVTTIMEQQIKPIEATTFSQRVKAMQARFNAMDMFKMATSIYLHR